MSDFREYEQYDALGLAELVSRKQVTAAELCEAAIDRIAAINPRLNAVVTPMFDHGRAATAAALPEGPFTGVPFLIKDLYYAYAGVPLSSGCRAFSTWVPDHDDEMVIRIKRAGAVILGRTNTPEFGLLAVTEPDLFGPCRNPWRTDRTPGGSSGGAAAAVAAGMVPMAAGGDGGGSIRIPAAYCGLFGLKPSRGRNPTGPDHGLVWQGAVQNHVITRSVRDSAAMLDATHGADAGAPYEIRPPARPFLEAVGTEPPPLKIAINATSPLNTPVHSDNVAAVRAAAKLLEELGHRVAAARPAIDGIALAKSYLTMYFGEVAADIDAMAATLKRKAGPADVERTTFILGLLGRSVSAGDFVTALRRWDLAAREMGRFFRRYDLYLTPTTAAPPALIGSLRPKGVEALLMGTVNTLRLGWLLKRTALLDDLAVKSLARTPFTQLANLCGLPAMSVPLHWTAAGLPVGVQFIAPFGAEATLFQLAGQLERARPWFDRRPQPAP
ncbi:MAG: amidase [Desulfosarcinaceae bacterium]|nr:amidase [Desulfosarcinaceae bacterium]